MPLSKVEIAIPGKAIDDEIRRSFYGMQQDELGMWYLEDGDMILREIVDRKYSTDCNDAMLIADDCDVFALERLSTKAFHYDTWYCELRRIGGKEITHAHGCSPQHAIALAAVKQV